MPRFKGVFNWKGQLFELKTKESMQSSDQALAKLVYGLSKQLGRNYSSVLNFFLGKPHSFEITPLKE